MLPLPPNRLLFEYTRYNYLGSNFTISSTCSSQENCAEFAYYLADFTEGSGTNIYGITLNDTDANLTLIANTGDEVHIAYNSANNLLYLVSKRGNQYTTLNPNVSSPTISAPVSFNENLGQIIGAAFSANGHLFLSSQSSNTIYAVNLVDNSISDYTVASITGGDIAFGNDQMLYLVSNHNGGKLYKTYPAGEEPNTLLAEIPDMTTGLAGTESNQLLLSRRGQSSLDLFNTDGTQEDISFALLLDGEPFTLHYGDMASGCNSSTPPSPGNCDNYKTFFAQYVADLNQTDIYTVDFSGSNAFLTPIVSIPFEVHIAFDAPNELLYAVSKTGSTIRTYSLSTQTFLEDVSINMAFHNITSAVFNPGDGLLYIGDAKMDQIYTVNPETGNAVLYGNAPVNGGDLAISDEGVLYLATETGSALYNLSIPNSPQFLGAIPSKATGLANSNNSMGLILSTYQSDVFTEINPMDASIINAYSAKLNGEPFTLMYGDMAAGCTDNSTTDIAHKVIKYGKTIKTQPRHKDLPQAKITSSPNPTSGESNIVFTTPAAGHTLLEVYDLNGRNIATLFNREAEANQKYSLNFNGSSLPNGIYIYRLTTQKETIIHKFIIAR